MTDQKPMEFSDINSDGPELSCQYIDGVIKRFPESKPTMEYVRTINAQLRHDRDGYAEMYKELRAENEIMKNEIKMAREALVDCFRFAKDGNAVKIELICDSEIKRIDQALRGADEKD